MEQDLINEFAKIGVTINENEVSEILQNGADNFLRRKRQHTSEENMSSLYIVLNDLRERGLAPNIAPTVSKSNICTENGRFEASYLDSHAV